MSAKRLINIKIHAAPIQAPPFAILPAYLINSINELIRKGIIYIAPVGNYGPLAGTVNPLAKFKNSIVVGGAKNDGSRLCSFSSRGIPGINYSGPTVVCPSEDLISRTHSGIISIIDSQKEKEYLFTREQFERQSYRKITDDEWEETKKQFVIGTGTSQAVEYLSNIILCIIEFRSQRNFFSDLRVVRSILTDMAIPISGYQNFEIGAGFVNYKIADDYLIEIDKENFTSKKKEFWSKQYILKDIEYGEIIVTWADNVNTPNQIDFTTGENLNSKEISIGKIIK